MPKETKTETKQEIEKACDRFGLCPECLREDGYLNVGRAHWFRCDQHQTKWCAGENLFRSWREQSPEEFEDNHRFLQRYVEVVPAYHDPEAPPEP